DQRRISELRDVPGGDLDGEPLIGAVPVFFHQLPRLGEFGLSSSSKSARRVTPSRRIGRSSSSSMRSGSTCASRSATETSRISSSSAGSTLSYETVRSWVLKFGPVIARRLRQRRPRPSDRWHLDEMVVRIAGKRMYLWRAVDHE